VGGAVAGSNRVNRGGSWNSDASNLQASNRNTNSRSNRNNNLGARCVSSGSARRAVVKAAAPVRKAMTMRPSPVPHRLQVRTKNPLPALAVLPHPGPAHSFCTTCGTSVASVRWLGKGGLVLYRIVTIPFDSEAGCFCEATLSEFLDGKEILEVIPRFFVDRGRPFWTVFVRFRPLEPSDGQSRPDREKTGNQRSRSSDVEATLDPQAKAIYKALLSWRSERARSDGIPPYIIMTNAQAAKLAQRRPTTLEGVRSVPGLGEKKVATYGKKILEVIHGSISGPQMAQPSGGGGGSDEGDVGP